MSGGGNAYIDVYGWIREIFESRNLCIVDEGVGDDVTVAIVNTKHNEL